MASPKKKVVKTNSQQGKSSKSRRKRSIAPWWKDKKVQWSLAAILFMTFVAYIPALSGEFNNWDDQLYVTDSKLIKDVSPSGLVKIFSTQVAANYHPLTVLSLAINYQISGLSPFSYHLFNVLLHLLNVFLVFYFAYLLTRRNLTIAAIAALFFGIHPMHVESVAWVSERKDVLYTAFFLAAMITYLKYLKHFSAKLKGKKANPQKYYLYTLLFFLLSLLSKGMAVVLPVVLLGIDFLKKRKVQKKAILEKIPFFVIALIFGIAALYIQTDRGAVGDMNRFSLMSKIGYASYGFVYYIVKFFAPTHLSSYHPYPNLTGTLTPIFYVAPFAVAALWGAATYTLKSQRMTFFGLFFYAVTVALVLQFISVGSALVAERYTYVSYIGLLLLVAYAYHDLTQRKGKQWALWKNIATGVLGFAALVFTYQTFERCKVWKNSETLWTDVMKKYPKEPKSYNSRGAYYSNNEQPAKAQIDFEKALSLMPAHDMAHYNIGNVYAEQKQYDLALKAYNRALQLKPNDPNVFMNRGNMYRDMGNHDAAMADYNKAIDRKPNHENYFNRGILYSQMGQADKALEDYNKAIEIKPTFADVYANRGNIYFQSKQVDKAMADYNKSVSLNDEYDKAYGNRGAAYFQKKQYDLALQDFDKAIELNDEYEDALMNRAATYMTLQKFDQAIEDLTAYIDLKPEKMNVSAYLWRGQAYLKLQQYDKALADLNQLIQLQPNKKAYYNTRADILEAMGKTQEAAADRAR
ncbi:MAG: tetratricopeptide repeat protein [Chitinophagales bacterium]